MWVRGLSREAAWGAGTVQLLPVYPPAPRPPHTHTPQALAYGWDSELVEFGGLLLCWARCPGPSATVLAQSPFPPATPLASHPPHTKWKPGSERLSALFRVTQLDTVRIQLKHYFLESVFSKS